MRWRLLSTEGQKGGMDELQIGTAKRVTHFHAVAGVDTDECILSVLFTQMNECTSDFSCCLVGLRMNTRSTPIRTRLYALTSS